VPLTALALLETTDAELDTEFVVRAVVLVITALLTEVLMLVLVLVTGPTPVDELLVAAVTVAGAVVVVIDSIALNCAHRASPMD
jgi:hypothetical protein